MNILHRSNENVKKKNTHLIVFHIVTINITITKVKQSNDFKYQCNNIKV